MADKAMIKVHSSDSRLLLLHC